MENNNRAFKGVWIPRDIWENKDLSVMEKVFLVEINSLDNDQGCFAGNRYFAEFFSVSKGRCSQIIKGLELKGYLTVELEYKSDSKQILKRTIRVKTPCLEYLTPPIKNIKDPYLENAEDNNTVFNNTSLFNKHSCPPPAESAQNRFEEFWNQYDKKTDREACLKLWGKLKQADRDKIFETLPAYVASTPDKQYRKGPASYIRKKAWNDEIVAKTQRQFDFKTPAQRREEANRQAGEGFLRGFDE